MTEKRPADRVVTFTLHLPPEALEALERLRQLTGKSSLEETAQSALKYFLRKRKGDSADWWKHPEEEEGE